MRKVIATMLLFCLVGCQKNKKVSPATNITVIIDVTDKLFIKPQAAPIMKLFDFEHIPQQAAHFQMVLLTDMRMNPGQEISLESGAISDESNRNDDVLYRERIINSFIQNSSSSLVAFPAQYTDSERSHSECFATIASELEKLSESKATQRTLIVFSDLHENEEDFSCYSEDDLALLESSPEKAANILLTRRSLPKNLVGVTVYFVFQPMSREEDYVYTMMLDIYQKLLKARGARVVAQTSATSFTP